MGYVTLYSRVRYSEKKAFCLRRFLLLPRSLSSLHNPVQGLLCPFFAGSSIPPAENAALGGPPPSAAPVGRCESDVWRALLLRESSPARLDCPVTCRKGRKGGEISCGPGDQNGLTGSIAKNRENYFVDYFSSIKFDQRFFPFACNQ